MDETEKARTIEESFRLTDGIYIVGSVERGVTVYSQQVRAHNLAWALYELNKSGAAKERRIAIVGGGIGGLTAAACMLGLFPDCQVSLFERTWDLCPLQQGSDSRWLHPRIYKWPEPESRNPSASIPILNWKEGRASDVADQILRSFGDYCNQDEQEQGCRLLVYLGVNHLRIASATRQIEWIGQRADRYGHFFRAAESLGRSERFDLVILAAGFGNEIFDAKYPSPRYWQNETLAQPVLDGTIQSYLISGYGDGALVDLCRLTIERFRQDRIVYDLFGSKPEVAEEQLCSLLEGAGSGANLYDLFARGSSVLQKAEQRLKERIRKDTRVALHLSGRSGSNKTLRDVFGDSSSVLNRLMLFLLYRCGAFYPTFTDLDDAVSSCGAREVICRHGPNAIDHVRRIFVDDDNVIRRLKQLKSSPKQSSSLEWRPGVFPTLRRV